jgi:hypothetical protein
VQLYEPQLLFETALGLSTVRRTGRVVLLELGVAELSECSRSCLAPGAAKVGKGIAEISG